MSTSNDQVSDQVNEQAHAQSSARGFQGLSRPGEMRSAMIGELELAYFISPSQSSSPNSDRDAERAPILLIHGLGEHAGYWSENSPSLIAAGHRVIIPDLAGHGRSAKPRRAYSVAWQAALMVGLLDALDLDEPVTVVGHSMGGQIAMRLAAAYPHRVKSLVLVAPAGVERFSDAEAAWLKRVSTPASLSGRSEAALRAHFKRSVFGRWGRAAEEHLAERLTLSEDPEFERYIHAMVASIHGMLDDSISRELNAIKTPVYLIFGEVDRLIPNPYLHSGDAGDVLDQAKRDLPLVRRALLLEGVGHMPQLEAPRRVERLILEAARAPREDPAERPSEG